MHAKHLLFAALALSLLGAAAWAAGSGEPHGDGNPVPSAGFPLTVTDDGGTPVTLAAKPVRIASLTMFTDEVLLELVAPRRIVAVTAFAVDPAISNVTAKAAGIPNKLSMNVEVLVSLKPDLLFAANWTEADKVKQLRAAGIPVYLTGTGVTFDGIAAKISRVGLLVGEPAKAAKPAAPKASINSMTRDTYSLMAIMGFNVSV